MVFEFHPWTIAFLVGAIITLYIGIHIVRVRAKSTARIFLGIVLFLFVFCWMIADFVENNMVDQSLALIMAKISVGCLSYAFFFFFLIPYHFLKPVDKDKRILFILIIPTIMLLAMVLGDSMDVKRMPTEENPWIEYDYDTPIYNAWATIGFATMAIAYILVIPVLRDQTLKKPFKKKIGIFIIGTLIAFVLAFFANIAGEIMWGWPPLSSLFVGVGMAIAALAFRKRRHE
ncbi:MAG: hypothetical protein A7316_08830 [Candidatus Altiarchaeales archaeon WOR_SM1_86-2]|nr:MAG: hypothetical protein A7316_08830 [Candidatus Altiarchaeales archaeon WOR_SM1_86-2]ODS40458.1 MAG: hypothetical protein A7315_08425 [Candidatus Altiarchaeales archaeon WOR_SM1_79]